MLDFKLIQNGEDFELFCEKLLRAMNFEIISRPARGADQGKDMIALREVHDEILGKKRDRFLIECKHHAFSGKSVKESESLNIFDRMEAENLSKRSHKKTTCTDCHKTRSMILRVNGWALLRAKSIILTR